MNKIIENTKKMYQIFFIVFCVIYMNVLSFEYKVKKI
jgi:hypothetical protein